MELFRKKLYFLLISYFSIDEKMELKKRLNKFELKYSSILRKIFNKNRRKIKKNIKNLTK